MEATAYWTVAPGRGELRREPLPVARAGEVLVRTVVSAVSRGTESLVHRHEVPEAIRDLMRAPFQEGDLPGPVKYGYLNVGVVEAGDPALLGRRVFCLHPHQDRFVVPATAVTPVPDEVPTARAVLAGTVETAINALWDGPPRFGDRCVVVGGGLIGFCVAALLRRFPLSGLQIVEPDVARGELLGALGVPIVPAADATGDADLAYHCSATEPGLAAALGLLGVEGELIELSWYGDAAPRVPLGEAFHARRLTLRASQVGRVGPARASRRSTSDRLGLALEALRDPVFDALLADPVPFSHLPALMDEVVAGRGGARVPLLAYPSSEEPCSN